MSHTTRCPDRRYWISGTSRPTVWRTRPGVGHSPIAIGRIEAAESMGTPVSRVDLTRPAVRPSRSQRAQHHRVDFDRVADKVASSEPRRRHDRKRSVAAQRPDRLHPQSIDCRA